MKTKGRIRVPSQANFTAFSLLLHRQFKLAQLSRHFGPRHPRLDPCTACQISLVTFPSRSTEGLVIHHHQVPHALAQCHFQGGNTSIRICSIMKLRNLCFILSPLIIPTSLRVIADRLRMTLVSGIQISPQSAFSPELALTIPVPSPVDSFSMPCSPVQILSGSMPTFIPSRTIAKPGLSQRLRHLPLVTLRCLCPNKTMGSILLGIMRQA